MEPAEDGLPAGNYATSVLDEILRTEEPARRVPDEPVIGGESTGAPTDGPLLDA